MRPVNESILHQGVTAKLWLQQSQTHCSWNKHAFHMSSAFRDSCEECLQDVGRAAVANAVMVFCNGRNVAKYNLTIVSDAVRIRQLDAQVQPCSCMQFVQSKIE